MLESFSFMWGWNEFKSEGEKLFSLEICCSFYRDVYFQVSKCDEDYIAQWRIELTRQEYFDDVVTPVMKAVGNSEHLLSRQEFVQLPQYQTALEKACPINTMIFTAQQKQLVDDLLSDLPDETIYKGGGLDGHSYDLQIYQPELKKYRSWCILPIEWNKIALVIDMLVSVADLESQRYGVKH
ncbi:MAG TPA: hypothetical protein DCO72_11095 [Ruminococcus sp.]|nr:hypothetical protein [Ruminococcus sp.]